MYILDKYVDWLVAGGLSLIVYAIISIFDINLISYGIAFTAFTLAQFINNPHFIASYGLLYVDERKRLFSNIYYIFVSSVVPILLIGLFVYAVTTKQPEIIGLMVNLMFFMVGLHYIRQIYGIGLISLGKMKIFLPQHLKTILNYSLFPTWFISYLNGNSAVYVNNFYGITYSSFGLPTILRDVNTLLFYASIFVWIGIVAYIVYTHKKWPITLIIVLASISLWHFPDFYNYGFSYLIPLFHSLQYLLIVAAVKRSQIGEEQKYIKYLVYMCTIGIVAYLVFRFIPEHLDKIMTYDRQMFGNTLYLAMFLMFINIHHYFIDALIWRKGSGVAKQV